jgi:hypothetical protein
MTNRSKGEEEKNSSKSSSSCPDDADHRSTDGNPTHREDFTRLVGAAARKRERED